MYTCENVSATRLQVLFVTHSRIIKQIAPWLHCQSGSGHSPSSGNSLLCGWRRKNGKKKIDQDFSKGAFSLQLQPIHNLCLTNIIRLHSTNILYTLRWWRYPWSASSSLRVPEAYRTSWRICRAPNYVNQNYHCTCSTTSFDFFAVPPTCRFSILIAADHAWDLYPRYQRREYHTGLPI